MAYSLLPNYTDTISTTKSLSRPDLSYSADFRVKSEDSETAILTNITSPKDRTEQIKFGFNDVANIYNGTGIDQSAYAPSLRGGRVLVQVSDVYSYVDTADLSAKRIDLPVSAQLVLKFPNFESIDENVLLTVVSRAVSALFDTDSTGTARLKALSRGVLVPSGL